MITDKEFYTLMDEITSGMHICSHFLMDGIDELGTRITGSPKGECRHFIITDGAPSKYRFRADVFVPISADDSNIRAYYNQHILPSVFFTAQTAGRLK